MPAKKNEKGNTYGRLTVIEEAGKNSNGKICWLCECSCDNHTKKVVSGTDLRSGRVKSCGCLHKEAAQIVGKNNKGRISDHRIDEVGKIYGKLTVLEYSNTVNNRAYWKCRCSCNKNNIIEVMGKYLRNGDVKSCGCLRSQGEEKISNILIENNIPFEKEKTFSDCINAATGRKLKFDFYVDNKYLIEFDGEQHYIKSNGFYSEDGQKRDFIKNTWAKNNNIPLIRIKYDMLDNLSLSDLIID